MLESAFPRDPEFTTSHLRRFVKPELLPDNLKPKRLENQGALGEPPLPSIYILIPPPHSDLPTIQALLAPYAPTPLLTTKPTPASLNIQSTRILLQPPTSVEQAEHYSRNFWPTIYNPAAHPAAHSPPPRILDRTQMAIKSGAGKYLALARRVADEAKESGRGRAIGVVAVDPSLAGAEDASPGDELNGVVAVAGDARYWGNICQYSNPELHPASAGVYDPDREGGPENHALMRLISIIANRRLSESSQTPAPSQHHKANSRKQTPSLSPLESSFLHPLPSPSRIQKNEDTSEPTPQAQSIPSANNISAVPDSDSSMVPYLCTSLDVYSTHDPCTCCAMGMVLSRFRAVIYLRDEARVGLGGLASTDSLNPSEAAAGYGLHWRRELNWRVLGFEFVEERSEAKGMEVNEGERFHA